MSDNGMMETESEKMADTLRTVFTNHYKTKIRTPARNDHNWASEIGFPCARYIALLRTDGDKRAPIEPRVAALFEMGEEIERQTKRLLLECGFDLLNSQLSFPANSYNIAGKIDGALYANRAKILTEIKGVNGRDFDGITGKGPEYLRDNRRVWLQKWYGQAQAYMVLSDVEHGLWILKNKWSGWVEPVPFRIDYAYAEKMLDRVDTANKAVAAGTLPDFIQDPDVCAACPFFGGVCNPPAVYQGLEVWTDPQAIEAAETYATLSDEIAAYEEKIDFRDAAAEWLKKAAKTRLPDDETKASFLAGRVQLAVSKFEKKAYTVKAQTQTTVRLTVLRRTDGDETARRAEEAEQDHAADSRTGADGA